MIKHFTIGTALAALVAAPAFAGGYTAPIIETAPQIEMVPAVVPAWTGGYLGANLNYGKGKVEGPNIAPSYKPDGASGAVRAGYDWQFSPQGVFGIGAEYNLGKYKDNIGGDEANLKNAATIFARAGYAFNENLLAYGLVGYSRAKLNMTAGPVSETVDGWTAGLGAEYRINDNWSSYAEYAHSDLGDVASAGIDKVKLDQVKLGVNFRF